jgi:class I lanthipeptide synthase
MLHEIKTTIDQRTQVPSARASAAFFVLRAPALPWDAFVEFSAGVTRCLNVAGCEGGFPLEMVHMLKRWVTEPLFREALWIASPSLSAQCESWSACDEADVEQRTLVSLLKYFVRATTRPTPFGLFATCSTGTIGQATRLTFGSRDTWRKATRFDSLVVHAFRDKLLAHEKTWQHIPVKPNGTLHRVAQRYHYVERIAREKSGSLYEYSLSTAEATPHLASVLKLATGITPVVLANRLATPNIGPDAWLDYLRVLLTEQVLVSDCEPIVTVIDPLAELLDRLDDSSLSAKVDTLQRRLRALDATGIGVSPEEYQTLATDTRETLSIEHSLPVFQVDASRRMQEATIGENVATEFLNSAALLQFLSMSCDWLKPFRDAFLERYDRYTQVALLEALDPEVGVRWTIPDMPQLPLRIEVRDALTRLFVEAINEGKYEIELTPEDVSGLAGGADIRLPNSFAVHGTIVAASPSDVEEGRFRVTVDSVSGPSGATLLARFCHCDPDLEARLISYCREEEATDPSVIFADLVHDPGERSANILFRPPLREYAIATLGHAHPHQREISLDDLYISVSDDDIILWSKALNKRVIPRLDTAHTYYKTGNLNVYAFLGLLQTNGPQSLRGWSWAHLDGAPFLPRVVYGRIVLRRAQWNVGRDELRSVSQADVEARSIINAWRRKRGIPRRVRLTNGDQTLLIDFDIPLSVQSFLGELRREERVRLVELYPDDEQLVVSGSNGKYFHELIIPFVSKEPAGVSRKSSPVAPVFLTESPITPISDWIYIKLYAGENLLNQVLRTAVTSMAKWMLSERLADRWFFVRYADPSPHLRVRFHGEALSLRTVALPKLDGWLRELLASGAVWRVQYDTYRREIGRYGGEQGTSCAERIFKHDSEAVLQLLARYGEEWENVRLIAGIMSVIEFSSDCGLGAPALYDFLQPASAGADAQTRRRRSDSYRSLRSQVDSAFHSNESKDDFDALRSAFRLRSDKNKGIVTDWLAECRKVGILPAHAIESAIHMSLNRIGLTRSDENDVYDFTSRVLRSQIARQSGRTTGHDRALSLTPAANS